MATKSDIHRERTVSATEASRTFSEILDEVEAGTRIHIVRRGREVCVMAPPAPELKRRKISDILESLKGKEEVTLDDEFGKDLLEIINLKRPPRELPEWD